MKDIIIQTQKGKVVRLNLEQLKQVLSQVRDKRKAKGKRYSLTYLLGVILLAKLSGEQKPAGIAEWVQLRWRELAELFEHERYVAPSQRTISNTLAETVSVDELEAQFQTFLYQEYGGQASKLVVIDGKTLRGTIPKGETRGVHLLTAYLPAENYWGPARP